MVARSAHRTDHRPRVDPQPGVPGSAGLQPRQPQHYRGLVQPADAEQTLNGFKLKKPRPIDWKKQYDRAVDVPARGGAHPPDKVFLPFEGDNTLSVILSKAFLLADDAKIKDATIVSQIKRS